MFESIRGKKVFVTGSSTGIGASIAEIFAEHGAQVGLHYASSETEVVAVQKKIEAGGGQAKIFQGDLTDPSARRELVPSFVQAFGGIDVLVNNAGATYGYNHFSDITEEEWDKTFDVNAKAPFFLSKDAIAHMKKQEWGRIINITSVSVKYAGPQSLHYAASKAPLETLTVGFSKDGAKNNVLVNSIRPGVIETPMRKKIPDYTDEQFEWRVSLVRLGHAGQPLDIARMALFLASEGGDFITGECFTVAGGD